MKINLSRKTIFILSLILTSIILTSIVLFLFLTLFNANTSTQIPVVNANPNPSTDNTFASILTCFSKPSNEQQKCLDDFISNYAQNQNKDTKQMLADLENGRTLNSQLETNCHPIAHAIGRFTYTKIGNIGDAFLACDQTCHSGCYHGVMERLFFSDKELSTTNHLTFDDLKTKIPGICDKDKFKNPSNAVIFQCLHGVGHAILYSLDYDLKTALKTCDLLADDYQRSSCYGGVVMENVTAFDKTKRDLKQSDPLYPCDSLDTKYRNDCYLMQTSVMYEYGMNDQQIAVECKQASPYEHSCFLSLGRDLSNFVRLNDTPRVVKACEDYSGDFSEACIDGTIYALIDNTWDGRFAYGYCNSLTNVTNQSTCYRDANNYLRGPYQETNDAITKNCNDYAGVNRDICLKS